MRIRALVPALLLLAACDTRPEDFTRARADTTAFHDRWQKQIDALTSRRDALFDRAGKVSAGTAGLTDVLSQLTAVKSQLDDLTTKVNTVRDDASGKLDARHRHLAEDALTDGDADLKPLIAGLGAQLDQAASKLTDAEKTAAATPPTPTTPPPPDGAGPGTPAPAPAVTGSITSPDFAHQKGQADIEGLAFLTGTAQLDPKQPNKALLDPVVTFAGTCDQLRFDIVGHTAKDGDAQVNQKLSQARALAIQTYLVAAGVPKFKFSRVYGVGGAQPLVAEPEPGTPQEKSMPTDKLAQIRDVNRRISIAVVSPCPTTT